MLSNTTKSGYILGSLDRKLKEIHTKYPCINMGGCGVFSALIYPYLTKRFKEVKIRALTYKTMDSSSIVEVRNNLINTELDPHDFQNWNSGVFYFTHILNEVDSHTLIDSNGACNKPLFLASSNYSMVEGEFTFEEMKSFSGVQSGWNRRFDRGLIPLIERDLETMFNSLRLTEAYRGEENG